LALKRCFLHFRTPKDLCVKEESTKIN
jgi:hypothetical protein